MRIHSRQNHAEAPHCQHINKQNQHGAAIKLFSISQLKKPNQTKNQLQTNKQTTRKFWKANKKAAAKKIQKYIVLYFAVASWKQRKITYIEKDVKFQKCYIMICSEMLTL